MVITEHELRKYLYASFLKKDKNNVFIFNSDKRIKNFQHKNNILIKEQSGIIPKTSNGGTRKNIIITLKASNSEFKPFFSDIVNISALTYATPRFFFITNEQEFNASEVTLDTLKNTANQVADYALDNYTRLTSLTNENIAKIKFKDFNDSKNFTMSFPISFVADKDTQGIVDGAEFVLGETPINEANGNLILYLEQTFKILTSHYAFQNLNSFGFNSDLFVKAIGGAYSKSFMVPTAGVGGSERYQRSSNAKLLIEKTLKYVGLFQVTLNALRLDKITAEAEKINFIKNEMNSDNNNEEFNIEKYAQFLQDKRKSGGVGNTPSLGWDTDQSFLNILALKNPGVQGAVDLTNILSGIASAYGRKIFGMNAAYIEFASALLSFVNRLSYKNFLKNELNRLERLKRIIDQGSITDEDGNTINLQDDNVKKEINDTLKELQTANINITSIDTLIEKIEEINHYEFIYASLDAVGGFALAATFLKAKFYAKFDQMASSRRIEIQLRVKPKLVLDSGTGKQIPLTAPRTKLDAAGQPMLDASGNEITEDVIQFENITTNKGEMSVDGSKVIKKEDGYYMIHSCMDPASDEIFAAAIEDQMELAEGFFAKNQKKLGQTVEYEVDDLTKPIKDSQTNQPVKDAFGNFVYEKKKVTGTALDELVEAYKTFRTGSNDTIYLSSLDLHLSKGDEFEAFFRLLGIATDPILSQHLVSFKKQGIKKLFDALDGLRVKTKNNTVKEFIEHTLESGNRIVFDYILKKYPFELTHAGKTYRITSADDLIKLDETIIKSSDDGSIPNNIYAGIADYFNPDNLKKFALDEMDKIIGYAPSKREFFEITDTTTGVKRRLKLKKDAQGNYEKTPSGQIKFDENEETIKKAKFLPTEYGNAVTKYLANIRDVKLNNLDILYDKVIKMQSKEVQSFLNNEQSKKILEILKNMDGQLVGGNLDMTDETLDGIIKVMKEYNARNQLFFMHLRLRQYGPASSAADVPMVDVLEDVLNKGSTGFNPQSANAADAIPVEPKIETGTEAKKTGVGTAHENILSYKKEINQQTQKAFDLNVADEDMLASTFKFNESSLGKLNADMLGQRLKLYQKTDINLVKAMEEWNQGINVQYQALDELLAAIETNLRNPPFNVTDKTLDSATQASKDKLTSFKNEIANYKSTLLEYKNASENASFYSKQGLGRSEFTAASASEGGGGGSFMELFLGSTGHGTGGIIKNPFDISNRQIIMIGGVINGFRVLRNTREKILDPLFEDTVRTADQIFKKLLYPVYKTLKDIFLNDILQLETALTESKLKNRSGILNKIYDNISKKNEKAKKLLDNVDYFIKKGGKFKYASSNLLLNFCIALLNAALAPVRVFINHPVLTSSVGALLIEKQAIENVANSATFRFCAEVNLSEQAAYYQSLFTKLLITAVFSGHNTQIKHVKDLFFEGISNYKLNMIKQISSYKKSIKKNFMELKNERQKNFLKKPNAELKKWSKGKNINRGQSVKIVEDMIENIQLANLGKSAIPISLRGTKEGNEGNTDFDSFLSKWSGTDTFKKDDDNTITRGPYLQKVKTTGSTYMLLSYNRYKSEIEKKLNDNKDNCKNFLNKFYNFDPSVNKKAVDHNWKMFRGIIDECFMAIKPKISQFEANSHQFSYNSYNLLLDEILSSSVIIENKINTTVQERLKKIIEKSSDTTQNPKDLLDSTLRTIYFSEDEVLKYTLTDEAINSLKSTFSAESFPDQFKKELIKNIEAANGEIGNKISKEIFSVPLTVNYGTTSKKEEMGIVNLFNLTTNHIKTVYENSTRVEKIEIFINSLRKIEQSKLMEMGSKDNTDGSVALKQYTIAIALRDKIDSKSNSFVNSLMLLDFVDLLKKPLGARGNRSSFYSKIDSQNFLQTVDNLIDYIDKGYIGLELRNDKYNLTVLKPETINKIKNDWQSKIQKGVQIDVTPYAAVWDDFQGGFSTNWTTIEEILNNIWAKYFKIRELYSTPNGEDGVVTYNNKGKDKLVSFLKMLRLTSAIKSLQTALEKIKKTFNIDNKNFLDITSILTGGLNSFSIDDDAITLPDQKDQRPVAQDRYLKNIEHVLLPKILQGSSSLPVNPLQVNVDYLDEDPSYLTQTYLDPEKGFQNLVSMHLAGMGRVSSENPDDFFETEADWALYVASEELHSLEEFEERAHTWFDATYGRIFKQLGVDFFKGSSRIFGTQLESTLPSASNESLFRKMKKNQGLLIEVEDTMSQSGQKTANSSEEIMNNTNKMQNNSNRYIELSNAKDTSNVKKKVKFSSETIDTLKLKVMSENPETLQYLYDFFKETSNLDINYKIENILKKENVIEDIFKNAKAVVGLYKKLNLSSNSKQIDILNKFLGQKSQITEDLKQINNFFEKLKTSNKEFEKISNFSIFDFILVKRDEVINLKKKYGIESDFYKKFNKIKNQLFSLDTTVDPSKIKNFDILKNKRSLAIANLFQKKIEQITNLTQDDEKIDVDNINNNLYITIEKLYKNADSDDVKEEGQNYLDFLKSIIQREFTEINVNSNIIGYELNDETQNIQKLVLLGDIQKLVTEQFDNEFFINLPIIYEINLESVYRKDPNFSFKVENLKKKTTNLKQNSFNYDYYQISDDNKTLAQALVKNKVLAMEFVGKIFEV